MSETSALRATTVERLQTWVIARYSPRQSILLASLLVLVGYVTLQQPRFLSIDNVLNISVQFSQIGIMAAGMTLVMIVGGIDLSVGSVLALGAFMVGITMKADLPVPFALVIALAAGTLAGAINGVGISYLRVPALIMTLGMLYAVRGLVLFYSGGTTVARGFPDSFKFLGGGSVGPIPVPALITVIIYVAFHVLLTRTPFGRYTIAIGTDPEASRRSGIQVERHVLKVYALCGAMAVVSGILITSQVDAASITLGTGSELDVIAAVVIGGTSLYGGRGSIPGTFFGVLFLAIVRNALDILNVSPFALTFAVGFLLLFSAGADVLSDRENLRRLLNSVSSTVGRRAHSRNGGIV